MFPPHLPPTSIRHVDASCKPPRNPRHLTRSVPDAKATLGFYRALGLTTTTQDPTGESGGVANCLDLTLSIVAGPATVQSESLPLSFVVVDLDASVAVAVRAGGKLIRPPFVSSWGNRAILSDPAGHRVLLTQRNAEPVSQAPLVAEVSPDQVWENLPRVSYVSAGKRQDISSESLEALRNGAESNFWAVMIVAGTSLVFVGLAVSLPALVRFLLFDLDLSPEKVSTLIQVAGWTFRGILWFSCLLALVGKVQMGEARQPFRSEMVYLAASLDVLALIGDVTTAFATDGDVLGCAMLATYCSFPAVILFSIYLSNTGVRLRHGVSERMAIVNSILWLILAVAAIPFGMELKSGQRPNVGLSRELPFSLALFGVGALVAIVLHGVILKLVASAAASYVRRSAQCDSDPDFTGIDSDTER